MILLSERWCLLQRRELEELLRLLTRLSNSGDREMLVERLWAEALDGAKVVEEPEAVGYPRCGGEKEL